MGLSANDLTGIGSVADLIKVGIDKIWPDKTEAERAQAALLLMQVQGQIDTNKIEAASTSVFVSGWRPFIGWVCGMALVWQFIVAPSVLWFMAIKGTPIVLPPLDTGTLIALLGSLLGLSTQRTIEKMAGVAAK